MKFHFFGQSKLIELPNTTTIQDLRALAWFNRVIKNYLMMQRIKKHLKK